MQEERSSVTALQSRRVVEVGAKVKMKQKEGWSKDAGAVEMSGNLDEQEESA
jgi:hypothetical protein